MTDLAQEQTFVQLDAESEWRFELESDENIAARTVMRASAETLLSPWSSQALLPASRIPDYAHVQSPDPVYINSEELPPVTWYPLLRHLKSAIYAPTPARLEVTSLPASQYSSSSTTQPALISLHLALERLRILARRASATTSSAGTGPSYGHADRPNGRGPRVMVLGPPSSGKTTVVKNLVNMALSSGLGWTPGVISLDPSSPSNLIPGSLSLATPSHTIPTHHLAQPIGSPPASVAADSLAADVPTIGWWYGHAEPTTKGAEVWRKLVAEMGERYKERCAKDATVRASGAFIDTSSAFANASLGAKKDDPKAKYTLLAHAIETFDVDTLLVIGHEKLSIDLTRIFAHLRVIRIPKSGGVVDVDDSYRQVVHAQQVRGYFYGEPPLPKPLDNLSGRMVGLQNSLSPYSFQIGWETLTIIRVGEDHAAPTTALPLGSSRILSPTRLSRVDPSGPAHITRLLNTVLAVVQLVPGDRIRKEKKPAEVKAEVKDEVKEEKTDGAEGDEGRVEESKGDEEEDDVVGDDEDEDEVPFREDIGWREVSGFIVITAIDTMRKKYTVLSPSPGKLPSKVAIAGAIEWVDSA